MSDRDELLLEHNTIPRGSAVAQPATDNDVAPGAFVIDEPPAAAAAGRAALDEFFYKDDDAELALDKRDPTLLPFDGVDDGPRQSYGSWYQTSYYINFFDVDVTDIKHRLIKVFAPTAALLDPVESSTASGPDLYGPMWIVTTLILLMPMVASLREWISTNVLGIPTKLAAMSAGDTFQHLTVAASFLYGYTALLALGVWISRKYFGLPMDLFRSICIHGYSLAPFIPAALLAIVPNRVLTTLVFLAAFVSSSAFQWINIWRVDAQTLDDDAESGEYGTVREPNKGVSLAIGALAIHLLFTSFLRVYFFR